MPYEREQTATLLGRLDEPPERLLVIAGPRQTGKTTMVLQALERMERTGRRNHYLPVDDPRSEIPPPSSATRTHSTIRKTPPTRLPASGTPSGWRASGNEHGCEPTARSAAMSLQSTKSRRSAAGRRWSRGCGMLTGVAAADCT